MSSQPERASRQRQLLGELRDKHQHLLDGLLEVRQLVKGSVYELRTRCGKPTCHCAAADGAQSYHAYLRLLRSGGMSVPSSRNWPSGL